MVLFSRSCSRRTIAGILLTASGLYFTGYIIIESYDVIVLTYMRSGSSFIGKLVGHRDDTFYWYEPLLATHRWQFHSKGQMLCNYRKDGCHNVTNSTSSVQNSLKLLLDIYNCNMKDHFHLFTPGYAGNPILAGATGQVFRNCRYSDSRCKTCLQGNVPNCRNCTRTKCEKCFLKPVKDCYDDWIKHCNKTKHRATKVLRMDTSHAHYLLENHKRLKLIQVFRDPRAVIGSRSATNWYYKEGYSPASDAKVLCKRMENDIESAEKLKSIYPDRVKIIQYEDFYDPNRTARILSDFLNMKITDYVKTHILGPLYATNPNKTSAFHPDSYRYKSDPENILMSNKYCQDVFRSLGLKMFNSTSEIKDKNLNVILNSIRYPLE